MKVWYPIVAIVALRIIYILADNLIPDELLYFAISDISDYLIPLLIFATIILAIRDVVRYIKKEKTNKDL